MVTNDDWLARTVEPTLEPELPICDPHHHLWDFRPGGVAPRYLLDFKRLTADYSADERTLLFHDTAARVYRLEPVRSIFPPRRAGEDSADGEQNPD